MTNTVARILDDVKERGLAAALDYTRLYDEVVLEPDAILFNPLERPAARLDSPLKEAIDFAMERIRGFHEATRPSLVATSPEPGLVLEERFMPLSRVGIYIPNGMYPLISTVMMTAIPAQVAGVPEIVAAVSPRRDIKSSPVWMYIFQRLGISQVLLLGGAQAIAALGYGFSGFKPVDLIAGPGNRYVTEAKQEMARRGVVGIDLTAGPSEVMVIANRVELEEFVMADLLAQAEHDADARAELLTLNPALADRIQKRTAELPPGMGQITVTLAVSKEEVLQLANQRAPEHLGLMGEDVEPWADSLWSAGAIFIGPLAGQAFGDYVAGPSHVLPTGGTGRFQSGLSTRTFLKRVSVIRTSSAVAPAAYRHAAELAHLEGLVRHEESMRLRQKRQEEVHAIEP